MLVQVTTVFHHFEMQFIAGILEWKWNKQLSLQNFFNVFPVQILWGLIKALFVIFLVSDIYILIRSPVCLYNWPPYSTRVAILKTKWNNTFHIICHSAFVQGIVIPNLFSYNCGMTDKLSPDYLILKKDLDPLGPVIKQY